MSSYYTQKLKNSASNQPRANKEETLSSLSMDIGMEDCIKGFFTYFDHALKQDNECLLEHKQLDYIKIKRFLHTAYNNLLDIDHEIETWQIKSLKSKIEEYYKY